MHTDEKMFEVRKIYLEEWKDIYPDVAEAHTRKKLEPLGEPVTIWVYVDVNHAGNLANRRFQSGNLIYVNNTLENSTERYRTQLNYQFLVHSWWH